MISRWLIAVRFVLSLCLVCNGLGAGASVHARDVFAMEQGDGDSAEPVRAAAADHAHATGIAPAGPEGPCHGARAASPADEPTTDTVSESDLSLPSCCHPAGCGGSCLQHPPGATSSWTSATLVTKVNRVATLRSLHSSPELPHLIRPPIA